MGRGIISLRMELFYFAHLLAGQRLSLFETDEPLLRVGDHLWLPPKCALHVDENLNRDYYRLKAGLGSLSLREQDALDDINSGECLVYLTRLLAMEFTGLYEKLQVQKAALPEDFPFELHFGNIRKGSMSTEVQAWDDKDGLYRADILLSPFELESHSKSPSKGIPYPEWDFRKRDYKPDWCWVQVTDFESRDDSWADSAGISPMSPP